LNSRRAPVFSGAPGGTYHRDAKSRSGGIIRLAEKPFAFFGDDDKG
jgi:hypothetical protein